MLIKMSIALIALSVCAAAAPPPEIADCKVYKVWQFANSLEGWHPGNNVGAFSLKGGVLSFTNTGPDPSIINTSVGSPDCSRYGRLGIKMRSSAGGSNQVYFATDKSTLGEGAVATCSLRGDGKFHFCEIDLSRVKTWTGKLAVLRIDPVNGTGEVGAKVDIEWIALYQAPARLMLGRPEQSYPEESRNGSGNPYISIPITNTGGEPTPSDMTITTDEFAQVVKPIQPGDMTTLDVRCKSTSGDIVVKGQAGGKTLFVVSMPQISTPFTAVRNVTPGRLNLEFSGPEARFVKAGISSARETQYVEPQEGLLSPLATLVYRDSQGTIHYDELSAPSHALNDQSGSPIANLSCTHKLAQGTATVKWRFANSADRPEVDVTCELSANAPVEVLRFEGPQLRLSGYGLWPQTLTHVLFPGLQYLEANEPYTATEFIGPKLADQHIPHPYKVTVPLMAFETPEGVMGMSWDPLQEWAPGHKLPSAQFEPKSKLATVFAPSIPEFVDENHDYAKTPYTLKPGQKITLKTRFFTDRGKKITDVIPDYFAAHGLPKSPPIAGGIEGAIDTCFKAYAGTLYSGGWKNHIGAHLPYTPNGQYAALVLGESLRKSRPELARKCNIDPTAQLAQYIGIPLDWFTEGAHGAADAAIEKQSPDGGFPYTVTEDMSKRIQEFKPMSGVDATTLGTVGKTNSGLIARELGAILDQAVRTGAKKYIDAGLLGLAKLNTFTVPRGAQTWEVHAHTPDVYAAALCVSANIAGYHLTRDEKYLDYARLWAQTGLPFVYSWVPPISPVPAAVLTYDENGEGKNLVFDKPGEFYSDTRRHVNPGASIAVFGTSFYVANWFGTPVQWCGLAWANSVRAYTRLRPDPVLQAVADSVFASGTQEQFDKGFAAGTYPDSWNLQSNTASTAFIAPDQIISYAYSTIGEKTPAGLSTESFKLPSGAARLNTLASIERITSSDGAIEATLKFYADQDVYACFVPVDSPTSVKVGDNSLAAADLRTAASGFYYDAERRALHVKYRVSSRTAELAVTW